MDHHELPPRAQPGQRRNWEPSGKSDAERRARALERARLMGRPWLYDRRGGRYLYALPDGRVIAGLEGR